MKLLILTLASIFVIKSCCTTSADEALKWVEIPIDEACPAGKSCVPKCCESAELLTFNFTDNSYDCTPRLNGLANFDPTIYKSPNNPWKSNDVAYFQSGWYRDLANRSCDKLYYHHGRVIGMTNEYFSPECFQVLTNGTMNTLDILKSWTNIRFGNYCVDGLQFQSTDDNDTLSYMFSGREEDYGILICEKDDVEDKPNFTPIYVSGLFIAAFFMVMTCIVYALLWKEQKLQGWDTISHSITMFLMYVFLGMDHLADNSFQGSTECKIIGIISHFLFLSNFCWLTTICFGLFWTFREIKPPNPNFRKKYYLHACSGWGIPFIFVMILVILDEYYRNLNPCTQALLPMYGEYKCFVAQHSISEYVYYPIACLLLLNTIFFAATFYSLYKYKISTQMAHENLKHKNQLIILMTKLFFVMGFTWIIEIISHFYGAPDSIGLVLLDMVNCYQAVAIFIIYVCKRNVLESLTKHYPILKRIFAFPAKISSQSTETENLTRAGDKGNVPMQNVGK